MHQKLECWFHATYVLYHAFCRCVKFAQSIKCHSHWWQNIPNSMVVSQMTSNKVKWKQMSPKPQFPEDWYPVTSCVCTGAPSSNPNSAWLRLPTGHSLCWDYSQATPCTATIHRPLLVLRLFRGHSCADTTHRPFPALRLLTGTPWAETTHRPLPALRLLTGHFLQGGGHEGFVQPPPPPPRI